MRLCGSTAPVRGEVLRCFSHRDGLLSYLLNVRDGVGALGQDPTLKPSSMKVFSSMTTSTCCRSSRQGVARG